MLKIKLELLFKHFLAKTTWNQQGIALNLLFFGLSLALFSCKNGTVAHDLEGTAAEVLAAYDESEEEGNTKFKGKWLKINGKVVEKGEDLEKNQPFLVLTDDGFEFSGIQCYFESKEVPDYPAGDIVELVGKCTGLQGFNVVLENCTPFE